MDYAQFKELLKSERARFRSVLARRLGANDPCAGFSGRIGLVLSGGGARGAYEAGALLAFQDSRLPTHIVAASSVGSINAAYYAAHSPTLVGNAEPLVESWAEISSPAVGIDWSRYVLMLAGLTAATAGFFNALQDFAAGHGIYLHSENAMLAWLALMVAGTAVLLLYDQLPYLGYVVVNYLRGGHWKPDRSKALRSLFANLVVWGVAYLVLSSTHLHVGPGEIRPMELGTRLLLLLLLAMIALWWFVVRARLSALSHRFLRLPLRSGLFPNYERTKLLRSQIPAPGLKASPMQVVVTATDLEAGTARYFTNASVEELRKDPRVNQIFASSEIEQCEDLLQAVIASSAFTIAYEAVPMLGRLWTDGGVVTNQPIRPAVRLGADVLFLVMVAPMDSHEVKRPRTFLDVGMRALEILVAKNLVADLKLLRRVNRTCEVYAQKLGLRPEEVELDFADQRYKFIKAFTISPQDPLQATALDFDGSLVAAAIVQGYRDGSRAALDFMDYVSTLPVAGLRRCVPLVTGDPVAT